MYYRSLIISRYARFRLPQMGMKGVKLLMQLEALPVGQDFRAD